MMKQVIFVAALVASASAFAPASRAFVSKTSLNAEWEKDWKEVNFEADLEKLQKEAEERLDGKIKELMANVESSGK